MLAVLPVCDDAGLSALVRASRLMWIKRLLFTLTVLVLLFLGYLWLALSWSYSSGERAGWVQKFSHKGWLCKTWEGELALVSLPGSTAEKFLFTVRDEAAAKKVREATGKRVTLHYEEKVGLPTSCFGETRHFVTDVSVTPDVPLGPGLVVPNVQMAPAAPAPAASK
jgi:hypothetical protein